jgi:predicted adenylyl cyclase CyaB
MMDKNVEIKAQIADWNSTVEIIRNLADTGPELLVQEDIFFHTEDGRLKLRTINDATSELIYYKRQDSLGPKRSSYLRVPVVDRAGMRELLRALNEEQGVVRKRRMLYTVNNTRIHLDQVEGLGNFIELEVILSSDQSDSVGIGIAKHLMTLLRISRNSLIECAYIDLLTQRHRAKLVG